MNPENIVKRIGSDVYCTLEITISLIVAAAAIHGGQALASMPMI